MIEPLRLSLVVACAREHAFETWTARASAWWPAGHTVSGDGDAEVVFEPRVKGRVYERTPGGAEIAWGEITAWEPPHRLAYRWHIATTPENATDVEIRFTALTDGSTQVEIEHRGWERLGEHGETWRDANRAGWDGVLPSYLAACAT